MKLSTLMDLAGAGSYVQGKCLPAGEEENETEHDGNFVGHRAPSFFIFDRIFEGHERA